MTDPTRPSLRGDAAWRAAKQEIDKRNDAARARGAAERKDADAKALARRDAMQRAEFENLPEQPEP